MDKKLDIKFSAADGILPDPNRERNAISSINNWLEPLVPEIIEKGVTAEIFIDESLIQHLSFSTNIDEDLLHRIQKALERYQFRLSGTNP